MPRPTLRTDFLSDEVLRKTEINVSESAFPVVMTLSSELSLEARVSSGFGA
ncbi:MAG: hypothetical protein U0939_07765 [Pirellulales bacterium]